MNDVEKFLTICILLLICVATLVIGYEAKQIIQYQNTAIEYGYMEYNNKTGELEWVPPEVEK